jgi:hypothetical protein
MAKSLRSKAKRSFRAKKRTEGAYAVADAVRLNRLSAKLAKVAQTTPLMDDEDAEDDRLDEGEKIPGWLMFGLLDPEDINSDSLGYWTQPAIRSTIRPGGRINVD